MLCTNVGPIPSLNPDGSAPESKEPPPRQQGPEPPLNDSCGQMQGPHLSPGSPAPERSLQADGAAPQAGVALELQAPRLDRTVPALHGFCRPLQLQEVCLLAVPAVAGLNQHRRALHLPQGPPHPRSSPTRLENTSGLQDGHVLGTLRPALATGPVPHLDDDGCRPQLAEPASCLVHLKHGLDDSGGRVHALQLPPGSQAPICHLDVGRGLL